MSKPAERSKSVGGSATGEAPFTLDVRSGTVGLMVRDEPVVVVVDGEAVVVVVVVGESRLAAVLKVEVRLVVEVVVEATEVVVELSSVDELAVCTGAKTHFGPGQCAPGAIEEAKQVAPSKRVDATAK
ncbi:MAG TPA: hypothetical protein VKP58_01370 [Candidatus Acidoferrum sp.]|nr:hypothetical protein [Candidatus Acidoferrum sp.]